MKPRRGRKNQRVLSLPNKSEKCVRWIGTPAARLRLWLKNVPIGLINSTGGLPLYSTLLL